MVFRVNKNIILIIISLLAFFLVSGCGTKVYQDGSATDVSECEDFKDSQFHYSCILDVAKYNGDPYICDNVVEAPFVHSDECKYSVILDSKEITDENICNKMGFNYKDLCFEEMIKRTGNADLCLQLSVGKDTCLDEQALLKKDAALCKKRVPCELSLNPDYCETVTEEEAASCFEWKAIKSSSIEPCGRIKDVKKRDWCYDRASTAIMGDREFREDKEFRISACNGLSTQDKKDLCLFTISALVGDKTICDEIQSKALQESCQTSMIIGDISIIG